MNRPTCATCPFYNAEADVGVNFHGFQSSTRFAGACQRRPEFTALHKKPTDWCGEHPDFPTFIAYTKEFDPPKEHK